MKYTFRLITVCVVILFVTAGSVNADLTINLTDDGSGGTNIEFVGSGIVINGGLIFAYADPTNGFTNLGSGFVSDTSITPSSPVFGGATMSDFFVTSAAGGGIGNESIQSNWTPATGFALNTANGQIFNLNAISYSIFNPGSYTLSRWAGGSNVGVVTLNIGAVIPEPGSLAILGVMTIAVISTRRRRINSRP